MGVVHCDMYERKLEGTLKSAYLVSNGTITRRPSHSLSTTAFSSASLYTSEYPAEYYIANDPLCGSTLLILISR